MEARCRNYTRIRMGRLCAVAVCWAAGQKRGRAVVPEALGELQECIRSIGFVRGRTEDGVWILPFDPQEPYYNFMMKEASGWSTLWLRAAGRARVDQPARRGRGV